MHDSMMNEQIELKLNIFVGNGLFRSKSIMPNVLLVGMIHISFACEL